MSTVPDEPMIPARLRRPLAAVWISLGLHAAVIALLQVSPQAAVGESTLVIEARLVDAHAAPVPEPAAAPLPHEVQAEETPPTLAPSETAAATPVAKPLVQAAPAVASPPASVSPVPAPAEAPAPAVAITSAVDLTYYNARDLDVLPRAIREIKPKYPEKAERQGVPGCVRLRLKHEADGRISDMEILSATPTGYFFEASALDAFRGEPFSPAIKQGRQVRALVVIEVQFDIDGQRIPCNPGR